MNLGEIFSKLDKRKINHGPDHVIGQHHRKLTGVGGVLVVTAALVAIVRASLGPALIASVMVPGPILAILVAGQTSKQWFHKLGMIFMAVHGVVLVGLMLWPLAAWKGGSPWNFEIFAFIVGFASLSLATLFLGGRSPIMEWRMGAAGFVAHVALLTFFLVCPHAPPAGALRWIMTAGVAVVAAGLAVWRHEIAVAARSPLPTARTV